MSRNLLLLVMLAFPIYGAPTALVTGTIRDTSGSVISGASVSIRNTDTGISQTTTTNAAGAYQLLGLQTGRYALSASAKGFDAVRRDDITLHVADQTRIDLQLSPGAAHQSATVNEVVPLTQTESATVSTVVNERAIQELPSDGRQLQNLALIVPGIDVGWNLSTAANRYGKARENTEGAFSVDGARARSNDFLFDGMPTNLRQYGVINFEPSNEAVQEFAVISAVPPASYGRTMGGQINIVTRAGSNQYHGSAYEFFRNDALNANGTLSKRAGLPRGEVRHNQFGGTIGGPIWKQKHFFFLNAELLRNLEGSETRTSNVPTLAERNGLIPYTDVSGAPRILNLAGCITPLSARLLALYPAPNASGPAGNYVTPLAIALNDYQYTLRTDHHFGENDIVTFRTSWDLNDQIYLVDRFGGPYIPGFTLPNPERTTNGTVSHLHTFNGEIVNESHLGVNRYSNILANGDPRSAAAFGLPNGSSANGIPTIAFAQGGLAGLGGLSWYNRDQDELTVYAADTLSWLIGAHSLKFGVEGSRYHFNTRGADDQRGTVYFDGSQNNLLPKTLANAEANVLTDLELGLPYQATITVGQFGRGYRQWAWAGFVQDTWRATRQVTVDYGLRYEYNTPWTEVNGKLANFVPGQGIVTPQTSGWQGLYQADKKNFGPRVGFAYDVLGTGRTLIRSGFGILYETLLQASTVQQIENNPPFSETAVTHTPTPFSSDGGTSLTLLDLQNNAQPSRSIAAVPVHLRTPYTMQFSLDIQQQIGQNWMAEVGYRGSRGVHLPFDYNLDQFPIAQLSPMQRSTIAAAIGAPRGTAPVLDTMRPYPGFNSIDYFANAANSTYHSLQLKLVRRFHAGLNLLVAYTWSKSIDDATDFASSDASEQVLNSENRKLQKAVSSFDVPQRFTAAFNYLLPSVGPKWLLGGWQLNGIITVQSGQPFTPYTSQFDPYRNESFNRLNLIGNPYANIPAGYAYNPGAFALPDLGTFGNSGRNIIRGDGYRSADLSVFRNFSLRESVRLQVRLEAQNGFNRVNYQGPVTDQSTTPGLFVATAPPRTVQLGAKLMF